MSTSDGATAPGGRVGTLASDVTSVLWSSARLVGYATISVLPLSLAVLAAIVAAAVVQGVGGAVVGPDGVLGVPLDQIVALVALAAMAVAAAVAFASLDEPLLGDSLAALDRVDSPTLLLVPAALVLGAAWSVLATRGWSPTLTVSLVALHFLVVLQVAEYGRSVRPLTLDRPWRYAFLGPGTAPLLYAALGLFPRYFFGVPSDERYGTALRAGRVGADATVVQLGPVIVGTGMLLLLGTPIALSLAYVVAQRGAGAYVRFVAEPSDADERPPALRDVVEERHPLAHRAGAVLAAAVAALVTSSDARGTVDGDPGLEGERKYEYEPAERSHRAAQRREPPVEKGEVVDLTLEEVEIRGRAATIRGRVRGFHVFVDQDYPRDLRVHDVVRVKILYFNDDRTAAHAAFLGFVERADDRC